MKKLIYTAIALAAVVVGCTKSNLVDVPEAQKTPITFDVYNGRTPVTKATEITTETIKTDGFYAAAFMHSETSTTPEGATEPVVIVNTDYTDDYMSSDVNYNNGWTTAIKAYWPAAGSLDFVAYGLNANKTVKETRGEITNDFPTIVFDETNKYTKFTYTVPAAVADQEDLVVSPCMPAVTMNTGGATNGTITFNMKHVLSRVGFKVQTVGSGATVRITGITLHGGFVNEGTVDLTSTTPSITPSTDATKITESYSLFTTGQEFSTNEGNTTVDIYDTTDDAATNAEDDRYMMIMPGEVQSLNGTKPYIEVKYQLTGQSTVQTAHLTLPDVENEGSTTTNWIFEAGKAYEFIFTVSISAIEFEGVVENWNEYGGNPIPVA